MSRKFYDVTMSIESGMLAWPSDGPVLVDRVRSMDAGERLNQSRLEMSVHTGTHIDAPVHFLREGEGVDSLSLDILIGPAAVIHIPGVRAIGASTLEAAGVVAGTDRLLIKTDNEGLLSQPEFNRDYCHLTPDGADYLIEQGVCLLGMDYLSVAEFGKGEWVHRALLKKRIVIIEGLDLAGVPQGTYKMMALPLRIIGCDGAPARVVLEADEGK